MSGEHQNDNDDDFLDDFVLDEGVGEGPEATPPQDPSEAQATTAFDELDLELDEEPDEERDGDPIPEISFDDPPLVDAAGDPAASAAPGEPDAEDMLFEDHTQGIEASVEFARKTQFDEANLNEWDGDALDLDEEPEVGQVGVPIDDEAGTPVELGFDADSLTAGDDVFGAELDSLLHQEDEFVLESDSELELVDAEMAVEDGTIESLAAADVDAFVIDDGEAGESWQEAEVATHGVVVEYGDEVVEAGSADDGWQEIELAKVGPAGGPEPEIADDNLEAAGDEYFGNLSPAAGDAGGEPEEEGWEPLPGTSMDELAEVDGVASPSDDGDAAYESDHEHYGEPALAAASLHEDHDIYSEAEEEAEVIGGYRDNHRMFGVLAASAAVLILGFGGLIAVYRPDWFGLRFEPERVEIAQVSRPFVSIDVGQPPLPSGVVTPEQPQVVVTEPPVVEVDPGGENPPQVGVKDPSVVDPIPVTPEVGTENPADVGPPSVVEGPEGPVVVPVPAPGPGDPGWPVAVAEGVPAPNSPGAPVGDLMRVGSDLLVGDAAELPARLAAEGVMLGSRAFAQLGNGNYFIGNVKAVDTRFITLRLASGEISLARDSIIRLTGLGSADYDELQKATSGFVRLTNNNRLIGSILESIADDHIILQTRANRVMLPKTAIGEIIRTEGSTDVRLGTTAEEDDWLRQISERQLEEGADPRATTPKPDGADPRSTTPKPDGAGRGN